MTQIDERFLSAHPRTTLWWEQREKCAVCAHVRPLGDNEQGHPNGVRCAVVDLPSPRQLVATNAKLRQGAFCIDARDEGAPCGPDAKLFAPVVGAATEGDDNSTVG